MSDSLEYPLASVPAPGTLFPVVPGVFWLRLPLPFALDHINLWVLEDGPGWTLIDTGIADEMTRAVWQDLLAGPLAGRPVRRVVCTHFHPDHMGLAGWLEAETGAPLWTTLGEWTYARMLWLEDDAAFVATARPFYQRSGLGDAALALVERRGNSYARRIVAPPASVRRVQGGERLTIGGRSWTAVIGRGHAPEHLSLWCPEDRLLISGDQVLPRISPNVSVWPSEPWADPLAGFLESLARFAPLDADTLVLPSHGEPFRGLHARLEDLATHHQARLDDVLAACRETPCSAFDLISVLFRRNLDSHQLFFAIGEVIAHLHWLEGKNLLQRQQEGEVDKFFVL
ncbi:MBL fold metallo-hydrolase [Pararhodospirillum oryzae]|uniref:MBL fold metallo-hydrolase n=1 Tax=Pararhodospirillum oryzae TaxID=478448 RepID=A0A512H9B8_9PROT|nr:MBL fold metallo-hydrolase [Pararhodospirillum oryzae]GEO82053.1 MBL fold metallo-hydrolase [Pararhodospirillum oryzae]